MTPIQKAKEIIRDFLQCYFGAPFESDDPKFQLEWERWLQTKSAAALLSGEDWKEEADGLAEALDYLMDGVSGLPALTAIEGVLIPHWNKAVEARSKYKNKQKSSRQP